MFRFAGFELDAERARLQGPDGEQIRLRPKSFDMLLLFVASPGQVLSKQQLTEVVWPNVHVSDDSIFQCIRELRTALGDERRQLIQLVSGRGYLFEADVSRVPKVAAPLGEAVAVDEQAAASATGSQSEPALLLPSPKGESAPGGKRFRLGFRSVSALAVAAGIGAVAGLSAATPFLAPDLLFARKTPTVLVLPFTAPGPDPQVAEMAANVTLRLTEGLAKIDKLRVLAPRPEPIPAQVAPQTAAATPPQADFVVSGELQMENRAWTLKARMSNSVTGEVRWSNSMSIGSDDTDVSLQQSRLAAGVGHPLALRINAMIESGSASTATDRDQPAGGTKVVIEQAMASINRTTPERFQAAQAMLEKALAADPDNVDLEVALAAHWLRGIQMVWYDPAAVPATEQNARAMLERAMRTKPNYIPVLDGYCRFLTATNQFVESLVACGQVLAFDPWDGLALYNLGLSQAQLGRFGDALATFKQADQFDTPQVSRWTWLLGAGLANVLMDRNEEAIPWLLRSIAITPGTGRTHGLLAVAYQRLGRTDDARAAMARTLELRPDSNATNILLPMKNVSPVYQESMQRILQALIDAGLPER